MYSLKDSNVCVIGRHGFIGSALTRKLISLGASVLPYPTRDTTVVFDMAGPTHLQFEQNAGFYTQDGVSRFLSLIATCREYGIRLAWSSSALLYEPGDRPYVCYKRSLEELQGVYDDLDSIALRLFAVYGVGEEDKGRYKTVIYQWCDDMCKGIPPQVYGDGTQRRAFIYIDDMVDAIISSALSDARGVVGLGSNDAVCFNDIVDEINDILNTKIMPCYINAPHDYRMESPTCSNPLVVSTPLSEGIRKVIASIKK